MAVRLTNSQCLSRKLPFLSLARERDQSKLACQYLIANVHKFRAAKTLQGIWMDDLLFEHLGLIVIKTW